MKKQTVLNVVIVLALIWLMVEVARFYLNEPSVWHWILLLVCMVFALVVVIALNHVQLNKKYRDRDA